jgi:hypothetical protein
MGNAYKVLAEKPEGRGYFGNVGIEKEMILKLVLMKERVRM